MKVYFTKIFSSYDGSPIYMEQSVDGRTSQPVLDMDGEKIPLTLRLAAIEVLGPMANMPGEEKCRRDRLAERIYNATQSIDITKDEADLLKKLINQVYPHPRIVRQAWDLLSGDEEQKEKQK